MAKYSGDGNVQLIEAAEAMNVRKRRIYDVTNVLEGIGLFKKTAKNKVGWISGNIDDLPLFNIGQEEIDPHYEDAGFFNDP